MSAQAAFHEAIENGDYRRLRALHSAVLPHLPPPRTDQDAEVSLHIARTQMETVAFKRRAYSHAWLVERGLPSQLPDRLKPKAERLYPRIVEAVFVGSLTLSKQGKEIKPQLLKAATDAVEDCYANGDRSPELVRARMFQARKRTFRQLLGVR